MSPKRVWLCHECGHKNPLDNKTFSCQSCGYMDSELLEAEALREAETDSYEGGSDSEAEYQSETEAERDLGKRIIFR